MLITAATPSPDATAGPQLRLSEKNAFNPCGLPAFFCSLRHLNPWTIILPIPMVVPIAAPAYATPVAFPINVSPADITAAAPKFLAIRLKKPTFCLRSPAPIFSDRVDDNLSISSTASKGRITIGLSLPTFSAIMPAKPAAWLTCASSAA